MLAAKNNNASYIFVMASILISILIKTSSKAIKNAASRIKKAETMSGLFLKKIETSCQDCAIIMAKIEKTINNN